MTRKISKTYKSQQQAAVKTKVTWITLLCGPLGRTKGRTQPTMPQMMVNRSTGTHEAPISIENLFARFYVKWLRFQNRCQNNFVKLPQYFFVCSFSFGSTRFKAESHMREERKARENSNCCFSSKSSFFCTEQISMSHATSWDFSQNIKSRLQLCEVVNFWMTVKCIMQPIKNPFY